MRLTPKEQASNLMSDFRLVVDAPPRRRTLLQLVHSELTLRSFSPGQRFALGVLCVAALVLRLALQHGRVFIGDEIGTLRYLKESPGYILTHFSTWLSMNYFILLEKGIAWLGGGKDWRLTLLPMAAAIAIIPLTASVALKFTGSRRTALIAAGLVAFNPYLVMWGVMIRAYSLLVALSLLAINEFFGWYQNQGWRRGIRVAGTVLLLVLTHLNGLYTVAFILLLMAAESVSRKDSGWRRFIWQSRTLWAPLAVTAILILAAYWQLLPDIAKVNREWGTDTPPTSLGYLPQVFLAYMGTAHAAILCLLFLIAGCWSALREKRGLLLLCGGVVLSPLLMSLQGVSVNTAAYARYLISSLPLILILASEGIDWFARFAWARRWQAITSWIVAALLILCWTPNIRAQFVAKSQWPYAKAARFLRSQMRGDDVIVAGWSVGFTLSQFFKYPEKRILLPNQYIKKVSKRLDDPTQGRVFYVTGSSGAAPGRKATVWHFGQVEVTLYEGNTPRALLEQWRDDLLLRTGERVWAPFEGDYQLLALLEQWAPSGRSADHWRALAEQCRAQRPSARDVPRHLEKATRAVIFP